jgi:alpha-galactosidase
MDTDSSMSTRWAQAHCATEPEPTITYRTGLVTYEESLSKGRFVGRGWNGAGFVNFYAGRLDPDQHPSPQAFWLEIDGQLLISDWKWVGFEQIEDERPHPASTQPYQVHTVITLKHALRPVEIRIHTGLDGTPVIARWLEITNTGEHPAALAAACPWSGVLQQVARWQMHLPDRESSLYSVGYMDNSHWGNEGDFQWHDLPTAGYRIDGRYRRDRHRHPMFVLRNNATGEIFFGQLAWSGGYSFDFDLDADQGTTDQTARLFFRAGPDAPAPQRIIAPGETVRTPEMHLGLTFGNLDDAVQAMHDHLRSSVFLEQPRGRGNWVESGIGPEVEITAEWVHSAIDAAADIGAEVFFIDASWYAPPNGNWWSTVGDWEVDLQRFPDGLEPFRRRAHEKGMLWGLWMDAERIGTESHIAAQHPDWISVAYDGEKRLGDLLDLTNPEAAQWLEETLARVFERNQLEFFRLDYNTSIGPGARVIRDGYAENSYWRYYEAQYALYERLRQRFPDVIFESCAGGGGRTDIGQVRRFSHTWVTDWQIAPRAFTITNGMTMALPPESVDRLVGGQAGHTAAELDFQLRLLLFVRPTFGFLRPLDMDWNPLLRERIRHTIQLYKEFVRPFMPTGRIYHHTPTLPGPEPQGWGVLELSSRDRDRGICGLFQLAAPSRPEYLLRLRGLDVSKRYRVTFDSTAQTCEIDGFTLIKQGLTVHLEGALTSELLLFEAI